MKLALFLLCLSVVIAVITLIVVVACRDCYCNKIGVANVGVTPAGMALTCDGRYLYVANNNNYGLTGYDGVSIINTKCPSQTMTITGTGFNQPYTITIDDKNSNAYVTNSNGSTVTVISTKRKSVTATISGFDGPSGLVINRKTGLAYVNNYGGPPPGVGSGNGTTVRVVDLATNTITGPAITVGLAPAALAITPNCRFVYVANYVSGNPGTGTISVISTSSNTVVATIESSLLSGPFFMAITPNGKRAYVTNFGSNNFSPFGTTVAVVNLKTNTVTEAITVGIQPSGVAITPDGRYVYVSNYNTLYAGSMFSDLTAGQGTVNVIDTKTNKVVGSTIPVGQSPNSVVISRNGKRVYVSNFTSNTVSIIDI